MIHQTKDTVEWLQFNHLSQFSSIKHFVSTRKGGVSQEPVAAMNLGFTNDEAASVIENRKRFAAALGFSPEQFVFQEQIHSCTVKVVSIEDAGSGLYDNESRIPESDAMVTNQKGLCLMAMAADCVPILLFDPMTETIAAIHAGWKGTVGRIAQNAVNVMMEQFGAKPSDILAGIGPSISKGNYEVGEELVERVKLSFKNYEPLIHWNLSTNKPHFDLWEANKQVLLDAGIANTNIEIAGLCSFIKGDLFYSYRRDAGITGRFGGGIMLV